MTEIRNINVPLVYILMKSKSKNSYEKIFNYIKRKVDNLNPKFITIDLEMAAFLALKSTFPEPKIVGCFFHFTQLLFRRIQRLGMTKLYKENMKIREVFRIVIILAFFPIDNIKLEYLKLRDYILKNNHFENFRPFWKDFESSIGYKIENDNFNDNSIFCIDFFFQSQSVL
ncbi:hypothetical protein DMUE_1800 [Dictyocoela muelleri]|nr:hypothetical protein DMUE_1800 [Dictyocoela muelleri]